MAQYVSIFCHKIVFFVLVGISIWVFIETSFIAILWWKSTHPLHEKVLKNLTHHKSHLVHCALFFEGLWGTTLTENTSNNRELFVRTTLRELLVYLVFLVDICLCKYSTHISKCLSLALVSLKIKEIMLISLVKLYFQSTFNAFYKQYHKVMCSFIRDFKDSPF